ncbi:MAG: hypothetical protein DI565_00525 [Ancylobacter novellus]|uniref:Uncharacterized protein n=1 Tax=Ancylobacter novellus TaxID=921 RepID=A0A2W5KW06_ANCNO|nr:MAG: hypothetical protein DI565_00525 [Ancylobacter novellus]
MSDPRMSITLADLKAAARGEAPAEPQPEGAPVPKTTGTARAIGYTGDVCGDCGGFRMRRTGACVVCDDCGRSGGCS